MGITLKQIYEQRYALRRGEELARAAEQAAELERLRDTFAAAALAGLLAQGDDGSFSEESYAVAAYRWADVMLRERERTFDAKPRELSDDQKTLRNAAGVLEPGGFKNLANELLSLSRRMTNHDAAPAARATADRYVRRAAADGESDRTDKAAPRPSEGTGDTPVTKPMPKAPTGSGSVTPDPYSKTCENLGFAPTIRDTTPPRNGALADGSVGASQTAIEPVAWAVVCGDCVDSMFTDRDEAVEWSCGIIPPPHIVPLYRSPTLTDAEREAVAWFATYGTDCPLAFTATLRGLLERLGGER